LGGKRYCVPPLSKSCEGHTTLETWSLLSCISSLTRIFGKFRFAGSNLVLFNFIANQIALQFQTAQRIKLHCIWRSTLPGSVNEFFLLTTGPFAIVELQNCVPACSHLRYSHVSVLKHSCDAQLKRWGSPLNGESWIFLFSCPVCFWSIVESSSFFTRIPVPSNQSTNKVIFHCSWSYLQHNLLSSRSVTYAENFHGGGVCFRVIWWSFVFGVRCLWRQNLTSCPCFQTNILAKFVDKIMHIFLHALPLFHMSLHWM